MHKYQFTLCFHAHCDVIKVLKSKLTWPLHFYLSLGIRSSSLLIKSKYVMIGHCYCIQWFLCFMTLTWICSFWYEIPFKWISVSLTRPSYYKSDKFSCNWFTPGLIWFRYEKGAMGGICFAKRWEVQAQKKIFLLARLIITYQSRSL